MRQDTKQHLSKMLGRRCAAMLHQMPRGGYAATGVNRNAVRAAAADDEIAEALAERAERKAKEKTPDA
jgi:hypothetical protein